jgi:long-chain acyl-CoA synthetase
VTLGVVRELVDGHLVRCLADRPGSVVEILARGVEQFADDVLLLDPALGRTVTYRQFADLVEGAAVSLLALDLTAGDRVAVLARNGLEIAVAIWACARADLVFVGLPVDAPPARLLELLDLISAARVLAQPDLAARLPGPVQDAADVLLGAPLPWQAETPWPDQDATYMLIPTSGTTGRPKAVRITGRMTGHAAAFYVHALGLGPTDRTAIHLPFGWVSGHITQLAPAMHSGGSAVTLAHYSAPALVAAVVEHRVTWLDVVPSIWEGLLRCDGFGLPALAGVRLAVFGGAPAPAGTLAQVHARLPQLDLHDVYALSETCAPVTHLPAALEGETVGRPAPYVELRIADTAGRPLPDGQVGEVQVRSGVVTPGYWGEAQLSLADGGWLRTGDLGSLDPQGRLTTAGRAVDLIIRGGVNIYPEEVERALLASGQLASAVAFGLPSPVSGQNVAAAVVALPGVEVDLTALRRSVQQALGAHAVPRPLRVVEVLPRNANGKVDRAVLVADWSA